MAKKCANILARQMHASSDSGNKMHPALAVFFIA
jgi:hypothetical protein